MEFVYGWVSAELMALVDETDVKVGQLGKAKNSQETKRDTMTIMPKTTEDDDDDVYSTNMRLAGTAQARLESTFNHGATRRR